MERWDLYTADRKPTGETHIRGEELPENRYHLVVHVWVRNSRGEYLISQRAADRPTFPLFWESIGGSVLQGETSLQGALREVKEEVGLDLSPDCGELVFSQVRDRIDGRKFGDILDVWLFTYDGEVDLSHATTKEVAQTRWMTPEQIDDLYQSGRLVRTLGYFFEKIAGKNKAE